MNLVPEQLVEHYISNLMNDYCELNIKLDTTAEYATDLIAALLADIGYESFVADNGTLTAYIPYGDFSEQKAKEVLNDFPLGNITEMSHRLIVGQDWNEEWEKHYFKPIVIANKCVIHSTFHTNVPEADYDIVIDPKMAFGTGHHATTTLILTRLLERDLTGLTVIDMGTGTGILAILAAMRGASDVTGIEIDGFAYENAVDNININNQSHIKLIHGDASALKCLKPADIFIANINRNVITADIAAYSLALKPCGTMYLSGFYETDIPVILEAAKAVGVIENSRHINPEGDPWACLELVKL